jgi:hypothetical protein
MPFSYHRCLIASGLQGLGYVRKALVYFRIERHDQVDVAVGSRQDRSTRRCANTVRYVTVVEEHAFFRDLVKVWGVVDASAIRGDGL